MTIQNKDVELWFRSYYGRVEPMLRVFKTKKHDESEDFRLRHEDLELLLKAGIYSGQFEVEPLKKPSKWPLIRFNF